MSNGRFFKDNFMRFFFRKGCLWIGGFCLFLSVTLILKESFMDTSDITVGETKGEPEERGHLRSQVNNLLDQIQKLKSVRGVPEDADGEIDPNFEPLQVGEVHPNEIEMKGKDEIDLILPSVAAMEIDNDAPVDDRLIAVEEILGDRLEEGLKIENGDGAVARDEETDEIEVIEKEEKLAKDVDGFRLTPYALLNIEVDGTQLTPLKLELYSEKLPLTSLNFERICQGGYTNPSGHILNYNGIRVNRLISGFMVQMGAIDTPGEHSIFGRSFPDEAFEYKHIDRGIVSMANAGPDTNASQFFITFGPTPHLDGKHVVFGHVVEGWDTLDKLETIETGYHDKPKQTIIISSCKLAD